MVVEMHALWQTERKKAFVLREGFWLGGRPFLTFMAIALVSCKFRMACSPDLGGVAPAAARIGELRLRPRQTQTHREVRKKTHVEEE